MIVAGHSVFIYYRETESGHVEWFGDILSLITKCGFFFVIRSIEYYGQNGHRRDLKAKVINFKVRIKFDLINLQTCKLRL